jgi:hypothetical protein
MLQMVGTEAGRIAMGRLSDFEASVLKHSDSQALQAMWSELRGDGVVPFRAELDAGRIGARAPFLAILEYVGPSNFRIRIAGDRLNKWFGLELRGMSALSIIDAASRNHLTAALNRVTGDPAVAAIHGEARAAGGFASPFEMVLLPMRSDFGKVDRVLVGVWLLDGRAFVPAPVRLHPDAITIAPVIESEADLDDALAAAPPPEPATEDDDAARAAEARREASEPMVREPGRRGHLRLVKKT